MDKTREQREQRQCVSCSGAGARQDLGWYDVATDEHPCVVTGYRPIDLGLPSIEWQPCPHCLLTPKQAEINRLLAGPQRHTLLYGGARSGKTALVCRAIMQRAIKAPGSRHAIVRFRGNAVYASIGLDTLPKVGKLWYPEFRLVDRVRSKGFFEVISPTDDWSSEIWLSGSDDKERVEKILGQEFCVDLKSKILTADLCWVEAENVPIGTEIIAFPEMLDGHQVLKRAIVERADIIEAEKYRIVTTRGETIVSAEHRFVSYHDDRRHRNFRLLSWRAAQDLRIGDKIRFACQPWEVSRSYEDGWMAGLFDGEGWLSEEGGMVGVAQNPGPVLDRAESWFKLNSVEFRRHDSTAPCVQLIAKGLWPSLRALGITRPLRLMPSSASLWENRRGFMARGGAAHQICASHTEESGRHVATVTAILPLGRGQVVAFKTSTATLIADGFLGHNCTLYSNECSQISYPTVLMLLTRLAQNVEIIEDGKKTGRYLVQRAYYDLNPVGTAHYTAMLFLRGLDPLSRRAIEDTEERRYAYMNPKDNIAYLGVKYLKSLDALPERQRKRFRDGVFQASIDGALWTFEALEAVRIEADEVPKTLERIVVAVDPSGTKGEEEKRSDDIGIMVVAKGRNGLCYVLADWTCNLPPEGWGRRVVEAYHQFRADAVVGETNFGGDMVRAVIHGVDGNVSFKEVVAARGKAVRAEPVSVLYGRARDDGGWQNGLVRHVGEFVELEEEMLNFSSAGYMGSRSPNRADAMVWGVTDLMVEEMKGQGLYELARIQAEEIEARKSGDGVLPSKTPAVGWATTTPSTPDASPITFEAEMQCWEELIAQRQPTGNEVAEHEALLVNILKERRAKAKADAEDAEKTRPVRDRQSLTDIYLEEARLIAEGKRTTPP